MSANKLKQIYEDMMARDQEVKEVTQEFVNFMHNDAEAMLNTAHALISYIKAACPYRLILTEAATYETEDKFPGIKIRLVDEAHDLNFVTIISSTALSVAKFDLVLWHIERMKKDILTFDLNKERVSV